MWRMSFLYRSALTIVRKPPYMDWANSLDDGGPALTDELARDRKSIYLVPEFEREPELSSVLEACWEDIFDEELAMWIEDENRWPEPRTREMFDQWFDAEIAMSVFDLVPEEPLTQSDVELADLHDAMSRCAWCEVDIEPEAGRVVSFTLADRSRFAHREGLVLPVAVRDERVVVGIMTPASSDESAHGEDVVFRVCTSRCEKAVRKAVPKALKAMK